jgi:purine-nucleoside phosphorylase
MPWWMMKGLKGHSKPFKKLFLPDHIYTISGFDHRKYGLCKSGIIYATVSKRGRMNPFVTIQDIDQATQYVLNKIKISPKVALVLGTGLGQLADQVIESVIIPYAEIPNWPVSTIQGHAGRLVLGTLMGIPVMVMQGRAHFYEGYTMDHVTLPIRVMQRMKIGTIILTNAAGAINPDYQPGDVMVLNDHIGLIGMAGMNPLRGPNLDVFGDRFPDMSQVYDRDLIKLAARIAKENKITLHQGVYVCLSGPSFESPADGRNVNCA